MINKTQIMELIGDDLAGGLHRGPDAMRKLRDAGVDETMAANIIRHYRWRDAMSHGVSQYASVPVGDERLPSDAELRQRLAALKAADDAKETAWEQQQRIASDRLAVAEHEAQHVVVGMDYGCTVASVAIHDDGSGIARFGHIPAECEVEVAAAGSVYDLRGLCDHGNQCDSQDVEAALDKMLSPEMTPQQREYARADILAHADTIIGMILDQRWEFRRWLVDRLVADGKVDGNECHTMWNEMYPDCDYR